MHLRDKKNTSTSIAIHDKICIPFGESNGFRQDQKLLSRWMSEIMATMFTVGFTNSIVVCAVWDSVKAVLRKLR